MNSLSYGSVSAQDADVIFRLSRELIDRYENVREIQYDKVLAWVRRKIEQNLAEYSRIIADGITVGYYRLHPAEGKTELDDFYVLPEYRGRGIGTQVLQTCIAQTQSPIFLYVFTENTDAIRLYERMGFRITKSAGSTRYIMEQT